MTKANEEQYTYLTTVGRKTGLPREIEIWFVELDGRIYILAEHGYKAHWVQNVIANPAVQVRIGDRRREAAGRVLGAEIDSELYLRVRAIAREKYGWGEGLPVEFRLGESAHT